MTIGIYTITCVPTGKLYVGSSLCIERRWSQHTKALNRGRHPNKRLQAAWKKHTEDGFAFTIVQTCGEGVLRKREQEFIVRYNSVIKGFNGTYETEFRKPAVIRLLKFNKRGELLNRCLSLNEKKSVARMGQVAFVGSLQATGVIVRKVVVDTGARSKNVRKRKSR